MGKQINNYIIGTYGNSIYYRMGDTYYIRSKPKKFKQTKATKARAVQFGYASRLGASIRSGLSDIISNRGDKKMLSRLLSSILKWQADPVGKMAVPQSGGNQLHAFAFQDGADTVFSRWRVPLQITQPTKDKIEIKIPEFVPKQAIVAPSKTAKVKCKIAAVVCDPVKGWYIGHASADFLIAYDKKAIAAQTISLNLSHPAASLLVTGMSLEYKILQSGRIVSNKDKSFMPAGIIGLSLIK